MEKISRAYLAAVAVALAGMGSLDALAAEPPAPATVEQIAKEGMATVEVLSKLASDIIDIANKDADLQKGNEKKALEIVDKKIMPMLDREKLAKRSVGKFWREASAEQKAKLADLVPRLLAKTYAKALFDLKGASVEFGPAKTAEGKSRISAKVKRPGSSQPMIVGFTTTMADGKVMVEDVILEGVSIMGAFAQSFGTVAGQKGLDGLIKDLEAKLG